MEVSAPDRLRGPLALEAAIGLLLAMPIAVAIGALAGRRGVRLLLRPLQAMQSAASGLRPPSPLELGVRPDTQELATLAAAFDDLLGRLGTALEQESRFTAQASHELRTPLTALRARTERLRDLAPAGSALRTDAELALPQVESLSRLVDALLLLARSEVGPLPEQPVNLSDVVRDAVLALERADPSGGVIAAVEAPDEVMIRGSEELMSRTVGNLLENARKFAGDGGRIHVQVSQEGEIAHLTVEDDGPGIPSEQRPFVFERFFRSPAVRATHTGTGLGLAVARAIVSRHAGTIEVGESVRLGGAAFRVTLPILKPRRQSVPSA